MYLIASTMLSLHFTFSVFWRDSSWKSRSSDMDHFCAHNDSIIFPKILTIFHFQLWESGAGERKSTPWALLVPEYIVRFVTDATSGTNIQLFNFLISNSPGTKISALFSALLYLYFFCSANVIQPSASAVLLLYRQSVFYVFCYVIPCFPVFFVCYFSHYVCLQK